MLPPINLSTYEQIEKVFQDLSVITTANLGVPATPTSDNLSGVVHAKLNWLLANLNTLITGRVVKSVQRDEAYGDSGSVYYITIAMVNPSKCMVLIDSPAYQSGINRMTALTANQMTMYGGTDGQYSWQVIEFY